ncbi:hypothetical protein HYW84_00905 [Candidatus Peregrinibacteria bacterium]|nr:hypothetical protein [Candidatus Peregrinibacteria bacterium]
MADFAAAIREHENLSEEAQKKAGQATGSDMDEKHKQFLADLIGMLDRKEMDASVPSSLLKQENYAKLGEEARDSVDYALLNLAGELRHIEWYFRSKTTPNASPQLQTMIEHLWDVKSRLEEKHGDVLKF